MHTTDPLPRKVRITPDQLKVLNERAAWPWLKDALLDWAVMIGGHRSGRRLEQSGRIRAGGPDPRQPAARAGVARARRHPLHPVA